MTNTVRPIDANALHRKILWYASDFPHETAKLGACLDILSMLGDENQTPTLAGFVPDYDGEKLTMDQLKCMVGKPVWSKKFEEWFLILKEDCKYLLFDKMGHYAPLWSDVIDRGLYAYPPARIDREKWTAEWVKYDGYTECSKCEYWYNSSENEDEGDRPAFCPSCGRAMTQGAMEVLESRFNG